MTMIYFAFHELNTLFSILFFQM